MRVRSLHGRAGRLKAGRFIVEGPQAVRSAIASGVRVRDVYVDADHADDFADLVGGAESLGARTTRVTASVMSAMAETQHPQGILAVCDLLPARDLSSVMSASGPVVVLDSVSDPGNVGTIIRTADAICAAAVILSPDCADVHSGKVVRSTAGSLFHLPVLSGWSIVDVAKAAHEAGRSVAVATGDGDLDLFAAADSRAVTDHTCWIIGSEAHGVSETARVVADVAVAIPMTGPLESLNASVAAAVLLYVTRHAESRVHQRGE